MGVRKSGQAWRKERRARVRGRLQLLCALENLSTRALASAIGASPSVVQSWLNGTNEPGAANLVALAERFNREPGWLLGLNRGYSRDGQSQGLRKGKALREALLDDAIARAASFAHADVERVRSALLAGQTMENLSVELLELCATELAARFAAREATELQRAAALAQSRVDTVRSALRSARRRAAPRGQATSESHHAEYDTDREFGARTGKDTR